VGDLSPDVNDDMLRKTFAAFPALSDARVMWDMNTGKSRGYGFLAFRDRTEAEQAIATMNGEWLGSRAIRVNWANQKTGGQQGGFGGGGGHGGGGPDMINGQPAMPAMMQLTPAQAPYNAQPAPVLPQQPQYVQPGGASYEIVVQQTPAYNTTVYVGNLVPYITQNDLVPLFQNFGYIVDIRLQADRGFAFVKLDTHENAAMAIVSLQGTNVHGRSIKCSWGKDSQSAQAAGATGATSPPQQQQQVPAQASPYANLDFSSSPYGPPDANALAYAQHWSNGDPNLIVQYGAFRSGND
jgi:nucleolysin TIA-1/TIAR